MLGFIFRVFEEAFPKRFASAMCSIANDVGHVTIE
jgi:hypothetical protein